MVEAIRENEQLGVFISYSRRDCLEFSKQLALALKALGHHPIIDLQGISGGEEWKPRLREMILESDTVVFVLSPESAISPICDWEVEEATQLGKRILPIIASPLEGATPPERLRQLNYIYFYSELSVPDSGFGHGLGKLDSALNSDLEWLREQSKMLLQAAAWQEKDRDPDRLIRGSLLKEAEAWLASRPVTAPDITDLQRAYLDASRQAEDKEAEVIRRQLAERERLLAEAEAAQQRAQEAQEAREAAQQREAEHAKAVVRRTLVGLGASLVLAAIAGWFGWTAEIRNQELISQKSKLSLAHQRLSTEMELRIAPFGSKAYAIPKHWYKLATTNAASIGFIEVRDQGKVRELGSGFVITGKALHPSWGDEKLFVTAQHIAIDGEDRIVRFPAISGDRATKLGKQLWVGTPQDQYVEGQGIDISILRIEGRLPLGVKSVDAVSDLDISEWKQVEFQNNGDTVKEAVAEPMPLLALGGTTLQKWEDPAKMPTLSLTLSLSKALGRAHQGADKIIFTDSTTIGSSGSPVFDASNGKVVAVLQIGTLAPNSGSGLDFSGGTTMRVLKEAIRKSFDLETAPIVPKMESSSSTLR